MEFDKIFIESEFIYDLDIDILEIVFIKEMNQLMILV